MSRCQRVVRGTACGNEGNLNPVVMLFPPSLSIQRQNGKVKAIRSRLSMNVCEDCARVTKLEDFMNEAAWLQLEAMFIAKGIVLPDRRHTQLMWVRLEESPIIQQAS